MISFCTTFYPWYREYDRSEEIFNVLIAGLNNLPEIENIELCITNGGVLDVWGTDRIFDNDKFYARLTSQFKGKLSYEISNELIHYDKSNTPRYWVANGFKKAIDMASNNHIFIIGIDCYVTRGFIEDYFHNVDNNHAWVVLATMSLNVRRVLVYESFKSAIRNYYCARGYVGITKENYYKIGGYDIKYIKNKSDSDFWDRLNASDIEIVEGKYDRFYHIWHPGSNMKKLR